MKAFSYALFLPPASGSPPDNVYVAASPPLLLSSKMDHHDGYCAQYPDVEFMRFCSFSPAGRFPGVGAEI